MDKLRHNLYLDKSLMKEIKNQAKKEDRSFNNMISIMAKEYLRDKKAPKDQKVG